MMMCILSLCVQRGELVALGWDDINFESRQVTIQNELVVREYAGKTIVCLVESKRPREIMMSEMLCKTLHKERIARKSEFLFPSPKNLSQFRHPQAVRKQIDKTVTTALGKRITIEELDNAVSVLKDTLGLGEDDIFSKIVKSDERIRVQKGNTRKPGTGCVSKINDNLWEGRYSPKVNGKRMARNVYAHTEEECEEKLAELIREMKIEIEKLKQGG